jgi:hypothetical protein
MERATMIDRDQYWSAHPDEMHAALALAELMVMQASSGAEYAACARFLVGAELVNEASDNLSALVLSRVNHCDLRDP